MNAGAGVTRPILAMFILANLFCASAEANLISHWKFDEGSGSTAYDSQGSNNGTIYGATWTTGQINGALNFDGTNDYVNIPNNASQQISTNQITLAAWIKLDTNIVGTQKRIICKQQSSGNSWGLELFGSGYGATGNQVAFHDSDGSSSWRNCVSPTLLNINQWYHIAVTDNAGQIKIYINGQLDSSFTNGYGIPSNINAPIAIGSTDPADNAFYFDGVIDDVMFYNDALTADEIHQLYTGVMGNNACNPQPPDGASDVNINVVLSWTPGPNAASHNVYFGTGFNDINNATAASSEYKGNQSLNANSYDPGLLEYGVTYYWRIDEINDVNSAKGFVWNFTTKIFFSS